MTSRAASTEIVYDADAVLAEARRLERAFAEELERWAHETAPEGHIFDELEARRAEQFFPRYLHHTRGRWAGRPFELTVWQRAVVRTTFGWKRPDGSRRFRIVYEEIPRKNGKTGFAAGLGLYLTFADREPGAEVYSFASDTDQAAICHDEAKRMVSMSPALSSRSMQYKRSIVVPKTNGAYRVISSTAGTKHGLNASGLIGDEVHTYTDRELYDALHTSTGARTQPLEFLITTAGWDRNSFCWQMHDYAEKVRSGVIDDPEFLPVLFGADRDDDYLSPFVWARANPSLGITLDLDYVAKEARRAATVPAYENTFKRLQLNIWTEQHSRWLPIEAWDRCKAPVDPDELIDRPCYGGLDLSRTTDISSLGLVFPPVRDGEPWKTLVWFWVPEENAILRAKRDRVPYPEWIARGLIEATPGNVVDYAFIRRRVNELGRRYRIREIGFDPWNATQLATELGEEDGFAMVEVRQGPRTLSEPMKFLEGLILDRRLAHGGNPVLRWMFSNVAVRMDANENIAPDKAKSTERIDGLVALIIALSRAIVQGGDDNVVSIPDDYEVVVV